MIPGFFAAGAMGDDGPPPEAVSYIGGAFHVDQVSASPVLAVPGSASPGDTVVVILRQRADRSMSGFAGWTMHQSQVIRSTLPESDVYTSVYILSRTLASETEFSFTHSAASAYGAALMVFRGGTVGNNALPDSQTVGITKASADSILLAVAFGSGAAVNPAASPPVFPGYTQRGISSFFSSPNYFFTTICETRAGVAAGPTSTTSTYSDGPQTAAWLAEIG